MLTVTPQMKNAARREPKAAANTITVVAYHPPHRPVNYPRQIFGNRDRRPAQPPAPAPRPESPQPKPHDGAGLALFVALVALQSGMLGTHQRTKAWTYVDGWAREITTAKHTERLA